MSEKRQKKLLKNRKKRRRQAELRKKGHAYEDTHQGGGRMFVEHTDQKPSLVAPGAIAAIVEHESKVEPGSGPVVADGKRKSIRMKLGRKDG